MVTAPPLVETAPPLVAVPFVTDVTALVKYPADAWLPHPYAVLPLLAYVAILVSKAQVLAAVFFNTPDVPDNPAIAVKSSSLG